MNKHEELLLELNNAMVDASERERKKARRLKIFLLIGKWFADNIVSLCSLVIAIIALCRSF